MSKREGYNLLFIFIIIAYFGGLNYAVDVFYQMFKAINTVLVSLNQDSILTMLFCYIISFTLVGLVLSRIGSPRGKEGHYIGKGLYIVISAIVGFILDYLSKIIFK